MSSTKDNVLNSLLAAHEAWFDVSRNQEFAGRVFPGYAEFHTRGEQYVLVKRAKLWEVASHEYIFFAESDHLIASEISELIEFVKTQGIKKVNPDEPNHMQSFISLVVITDAADDEALKIAQEGILYAKDPRDARIMIAVNQGNATVTGINLMLEQEGLPILK